MSSQPSPSTEYLRAKVQCSCYGVQVTGSISGTRLPARQLKANPECKQCKGIGWYRPQGK